MFAEMTVRQFLDALASPDPTPGGGSAAAMAGAMGTALLMMVAGLAKSRSNDASGQVALADARAALAGVRDRLIALADTDTEAFNAVMAAYRLPRSTDDEKAARKTAIQLALTLATEAPLDTLRATAQSMQHAVVVAANGNRAAVSDIGVGVALLEAAATGAAANVRINLDGLHDDAFKRSAGDDATELVRRLASDAAAARAALAT